MRLLRPHFIFSFLPLLAIVFLSACTSKLYVGFSNDSQTVLKNAGTVSVPVRLNRSSRMSFPVPNTPSQTNNISVSVAYSVSGTAINPTDFELTSGTLRIPPGDSQGIITFPIYNDNKYSGDKTVVLNLSSPANALLGLPETHTVTLQEVNLPPEVNFRYASRIISEGAGTVYVHVDLADTSYLDSVIPFTVSGTSAAGVDHDLASGSFTIPAGQTTTYFSFNMIDDLSMESDETIILTMGAGTHSTLGITTQQIITVIDNDNLPTVNFDLDNAVVSEADGTINVGVSLNRTTAFDVTTPYSIGGSASRPADHNLVDGTVTILAGATTATISFAVVDDAIDENNETVTLTMGAPDFANKGSHDLHTVTIADNDPAPSVSFSAANQSVGEGGGSATVTATLSAVSGLDVTVPFTIGGTANNPADHNAVAGDITITAGSLNGTTTIGIVNDVLYENNETVILTMGAPTNAGAGATTTHTLTITENDSPPTVNHATISQNVAENGAAVTVTVNLSEVSGLDTTVPYTVGGTSSNPGDHNLSANSLIISAGSLSGNISFNLNNDTTYEAAETATVNLWAPTNGTLGAAINHTVNISDDDPVPAISFSAVSQTVSESVGTVFVIVVMSNASYQNCSVPFLVGGSATNPADHNLAAGTITINAGLTLGQQTFSVVDDGVNEGSETVVLTMGSPTNCSSGVTTTHTTTINDDDYKFDKGKLALWLKSHEGVVEDPHQSIYRWGKLDWLKSPDKPFLLGSLQAFPFVSFASFVDPWWSPMKVETVSGKIYTIEREVKKEVEGQEYLFRYWDDSLSEGADRFLQNTTELSELLWFSSLQTNSACEVETYLAMKYGLSKIRCGGSP